MGAQQPLGIGWAVATRRAGKAPVLGRIRVVIERRGTGAGEHTGNAKKQPKVQQKASGAAVTAVGPVWVLS